MSFPLSAPPSEPQSRGHFYWALKGTLSLGFNRPVSLVRRIFQYSESADGLRRPRIFRAGFGGPATRGSLLPNGLLEPRRWAAGGSAPMAAGRTLQYPRRSCVRVFGPAWRFQSCAFVLQAATRSDVMRVADSLRAGLNSLSVPEVFRQRSSRRFHNSGVVVLHVPVELRSDSTRAEFGCDCFFRNGTTRAGNL